MNTSILLLASVLWIVNAYAHFVVACCGLESHVHYCLFFRGIFVLRYTHWCCCSHCNGHFSGDLFCPAWLVFPSLPQLVTSHCCIVLIVGRAGQFLLIISVVPIIVGNYVLRSAAFAFLLSFYYLSCCWLYSHIFVLIVIFPLLLLLADGQLLLEFSLLFGYIPVLVLNGHITSSSPGMSGYCWAYPVPIVEPLPYRLVPPLESQSINHLTTLIFTSKHSCQA